MGAPSVIGIAKIEGSSLQCTVIAASKPYVVVTDASGLAAGGVLMQDQGKGLYAPWNL